MKNLQVSISLSPDKQTFMTGSVDKTAKLWDIREGKPKQTFFGHSADVNCVCVRISPILLQITKKFQFNLVILIISSTIPVVRPLLQHLRIKQLDCLTFDRINKSLIMFHRIQTAVLHHVVRRLIIYYYY